MPSPVVDMTNTMSGVSSNSVCSHPLCQLGAEEIVRVATDAIELVHIFHGGGPSVATSCTTDPLGDINRRSRHGGSQDEQRTSLKRRWWHLRKMHFAR